MIKNFVFAFFIVVVFYVFPATAQDQTARPPNIIFILADDLSYRDLSCFGQKHFSTPHIDRLASEGRVFENAYAGAPWCAPSRSALMTGMNGNHFKPLETDKKGRGTKFNPTVAEMLRTAGYVTGVVGKWHLLEPDQNSSANPYAKPWNRGFDVSCIMPHAANYHFPDRLERGEDNIMHLPENRGMRAYIRKRCYNANKAAGMYNKAGRLRDSRGKPGTQLRYVEDIYREEARSFMRKNKETPFFLFYSTPLVHGPLVVKELGRFKDKPGWSMGQKLWAVMVEELDRSVGLLMDEVKALGIEKNTIVIFASDNGYSMWGYLGRKPWTGDKLFNNKGPWNRGKFITTNGGMIVPFIAWGPGRVAAGKTGRAINFYDFMATAAELADGKFPGPTDGVSFVPLLEGRDKDQPLRSSMLWPVSTILGDRGFRDDWMPTGKKDPKQYRPDAVLLDEKWFALAIRKKRRPAPPVIRLFDIATDPGLKDDLSANHPDLCQRAIEIVMGKVEK